MGSNINKNNTEACNSSIYNWLIAPQTDSSMQAHVKTEQLTQNNHEVEMNSLTLDLDDAETAFFSVYLLATHCTTN